MKVAFLDRDGTINRDYPDNEWKNVLFPELLEGTIQGMKYLLSKNFKIIIITNQYIIGEKVITLEQYYDFTNKLLTLLNKYDIPILDIFFCPHSRTGQCDCCKPKTGLIKNAIKNILK